MNLCEEFHETASYYPFNLIFKKEQEVVMLDKWKPVSSAKERKK